MKPGGGGTRTSIGGQHQVQRREILKPPEDLIDAARKQATDVVNELAAKNAIAGKVHSSYAAFRERTAPWSRVSIESVLRARG